MHIIVFCYNSAKIRVNLRKKHNAIWLMDELKMVLCGEKTNLDFIFTPFSSVCLEMFISFHMGWYVPLLHLVSILEKKQSKVYMSFLFVHSVSHLLHSGSIGKDFHVNVEEKTKKAMYTVGECGHLFTAGSR